MFFEFTVHPAFNFIESFAKKLNVPVLNNRLWIPESLGSGHIKKIDIEPDLKFVMHSYILKQDFHLKRIEPEQENEIISIIFNSNEIPIHLLAEKLNVIQFLKDKGSAIQIASSSLATETFFPANSQI